MFALKIGGLIEAREYIEAGWPTRVVRLLAYTETEVPIVSERYLQIDVDDVVEAKKGRIVPAKTHLQAILRFTESLTDDDRLLVHCLGGIGRSPAIAIGICLQHGMTVKDAFDHVANVRNILQPNRAFIKLIDTHFKLRGQLIDYVENHRGRSF